MTAEPTLDTLTKLKLGAFATQMAATHPDQAKTIFTLQDTLEQRLPLNVQNQIIEKLNKDPNGTLAAAKDLINKDPKILDEVNKNPLKLATIMGVKTETAPAPTTAAPAATPAPKAEPVAPTATPETKAPEAKAPAVPAKPEPVSVDAAPAAQAPKPVSDAEMAMRKQLGEESAAITQMKGFDEFSARAAKSQSLTQALDAMMGQGASTPEETLKSLQDIRSDPDFFVKANEAIDSIPEQMQDNVFTQIAENPELGKKALQGDQGAKMQLTMGGVFGGQGLAGLFSGDGMKGIGEMLSNLLPRLLEGLKALLGNLMGGLDKFAKSDGVMRMGNDPDLTRNFSTMIDKNMGLDNSKKPVIDAVNPDKPAVAMADLGKGATPPFSPPEAQRKLEQQQPGAAIS